MDTPLRPPRYSEQRLRNGCQSPLLDTSASVDRHPPSALAIGDHIFERTVTDTMTRWGLSLCHATYHRHVVTDISRSNGHWQWHFKNRFPANITFAKTLHSPDPTVSSSPPPGMPDFPHRESTPRDSPDWTLTRWECRPRSPPSIQDSPKTLTFTELSGRHARTIANQLLAGGPDGQFDHVLPGVQKWKHAFVASKYGVPYSLAILAQPYNSDTGRGTGDHTLYLTRLCNHPAAPKNTSSWMIGRLRGWLRANTDVKKLIAIAGVDGNPGTVYKAAGMEKTTTTTVTSDDPSLGTWTKHRWEASL